MKQKQLSTITMILSIAFFLVTSAFTLVPDMPDTSIETPIEVVSGCDT